MHTGEGGGRGGGRGRQRERGGGRKMHDQRSRAKCQWICRRLSVSVLASTFIQLTCWLNALSSCWNCCWRALQAKTSEIHSFRAIILRSPTLLLRLAVNEQSELLPHVDRASCVFVGCEKICTKCTYFSRDIFNSQLGFVQCVCNGMANGWWVKRRRVHFRLDELSVHRSLAVNAVGRRSYFGAINGPCISTAINEHDKNHRLND